MNRNTGVGKSNLLLGLAAVLVAISWCAATARADPPIASPAPNVTFTVTGPDGKPVAGATVAIYLLSAEKWQAPPLQTDALGQCSVYAKPVTDEPTFFGRYAVYQPGLAVAGGNLVPGQITVQLQLGQSIDGGVVDESHRPLPNTAIQLNSLYKPGETSQAGYLFILLGDSPLVDHFTVRSDATGHWKFNDVPAGFSAVVTLADPRFAADRLQFKVGTPPDRSLVAHPGAILAGRVVYPDGKPVVGFNVDVQSQDPDLGAGEGATDADGRFSISMLGAGQYNVMCRTAKVLPDWVAAAQEGVVAQAGQTTTLPDIVLTHGGLVQGRVTDADSGKPLAAAMIGAYGPANPKSSAEVTDAPTDANGNYNLRLPAGTNYIYLMGKPPGYQYPESGSPYGNSLLPIELTEGATTTLSFALPRSLSASGYITDMSGKPALGARVFLYRRSRGVSSNERGVAADAKGHWQLNDLPSGDLQVLVLGPWTLVEPDTVNLPSDGPVRIVVDPLTYTGITGLVVTPQSQPIGDATVDVSACPPNATCVNSTTTSDATGHFSVQDSSPHGALSLTISKANYKYASGGQAIEGANVRISPAVLVPLDSMAHGRVLDAAGAPVAGAHVYCPNGNADAVATSGADGSFALSHVPSTGFELVAVNEKEFALAHVDASTREVSMTLGSQQQGAPLAAEESLALVQDMAERSAGNQSVVDSIAVEMARGDLRRALVMSQRIDGSVPDMQLGRLLASASEAPNLDVRLSEATLNRIHDKTVWMQAVERIGVPIAAADRPTAQVIYQRFKSLLPPRPAEQGDIEAYLAATRLALALEQPDTAMFFDKALTTATSAPIFLAMSLPEIAKIDPATGRPLFERLATTTPPPVDKDSPAEIYDAACMDAIAAAGALDPAAAVALAHKVRSVSCRSVSLALAAGFAEPKAATAFFREAFALTDGKDNNLPLVAALAMSSQPELGREFFRTLQERLGPVTENEQPYVINMLDTFAYYNVRVDPEASRAMLEAHIARLRQSFRRPDDGRKMLGPILAMASLDPKRALDLFDAEPVENNDWLTGAVARGLALYLTTPASLRNAVRRDDRNGFAYGSYLKALGY